jgi:uncharacterized protein YjbJ (UPF0337 family)
MTGNGNRMQFEGKFDQYKGRIKEAWGVLSDDEIDRTEGKFDRLVGVIKEKTGDTHEVVERKLQDILNR